MVDCFEGLRHDAVIGGDNEHGNIRYLSAAGAHGRKGFMTRSIQEGNFLTVKVDLIGADMLGNTAGFTIHDIAGTYGVQ